MIDKNMQQMKRMEAILDFILDNLNTVTLEKTAEALGYNPAYLARIFRNYYEYPFHKYVMMLRLRKAAQGIYDSGEVGRLGSEAGFRYLPGFSNAFKKEFGISPREFQKEGCQVPDMPIRKTLDGARIEMHYLLSSEVKIAGRVIYPRNGNRTDLMEEAAYGLEAGYGSLDGDIQYGIWDNDEDGNRIYILGEETEADETSSPDEVIRRIHTDQYAVFRIPAAETMEASVRRQRMLIRYVFKEWQNVNRKVTNRMGITYEFFGQGWMGIGLPLIRGLNGYETVAGAEWYRDRWIDYINEHICENLTTERMAGWFNYSETIFRTTFYTKYGMTAADYIMKRRLILAAEEIEQGLGRPERIARKYGFTSLERMQSLFYQNFDTQSHMVGEVSLSLINLPEYYENNRQRFRISYQKLDSFVVDGQRIESIQEENVYDIHEVTAYWFERLSLEENSEGELFALWGALENVSPGEDRYGYYIGSCASEHFQGYGRYTGNRKIPVEGGKFIVFETIDDRDEDKLKEKYTMLERCSFYNWVRENRMRYDEERITFTCYRNHKLYFYIPIKK